MNKCNKCGELKELNDFGKCSQMKDGLYHVCKVCRNAQNRLWDASNPDKVRESRMKWANSAKAKENARRWYFEHSDKVKERANQWSAKNPEKKRDSVKRWAHKNPQKVAAIAHRTRSKMRSTPRGKLNANMSCSICLDLQRGVKAGRHWEDLVGYTVDQLKRHLENKFQLGMTWDNYGKYWHVDHKIPVSAFNFETPEDLDFKKCWSLKNLQPLEAIQNKRKNAKIDKPFQPSLAIKASMEAA